ncbi:MAG: hypothetical protein AAFR21_16855 [Pseudomonadota bacterium]
MLDGVLTQSFHQPINLAFVVIRHFRMQTNRCFVRHQQALFKFTPPVTVGVHRILDFFWVDAAFNCFDVALACALQFGDFRAKPIGLRRFCPAELVNLFCVLLAEHIKQFWRQ